MKFTRIMSSENEDLINKIVHLMETDKAVDAPVDSIQWSKNLFRTRALEPKKSIIRRVFAVLQMDLSPGKAAFGERSASGAEARQMLFAANDSQIDLRIVKTDKKFTIAGQILGADFTGAKIELIGGEKTFTGEMNDLSEFKFNDILKGKYNLSLIGEDQEIIIENIEIE